MPEIDAVWSRISAHEGETFHQIRGQAFSYTISGSALRPSTTNQSIPKTHFSQALDLVPLSSTTPVQHLRGPSYIYAVLMDNRIRNGEW